MVRRILFCMVFVCLVQSVSAQVFMTRTGHVEFTSSVPLHSFTGSSEHLVGQINLNDNTVDFYVDLNSIDTGIGKRDKDMRQTLDTKNHPFAEFFGELVTSFDTSNSGEQPASVEGEFSIHGVTRKVKIDGTLQKTEEGLLVKADWIVNLKDYDIEPPGILFYRVDEEQKIKIDALLTPVEESTAQE